MIKRPSLWRSLDFLPKTKYLSIKLSELFLLIYKLLHQFLLLTPCLYTLENNRVRQLRVSSLVSKLEVLTNIVWSGGSSKWKYPMHEEPNRKTSEFKSLLKECHLEFTKQWFLPNTYKAWMTLAHTGSSLAYLSPCITLVKPLQPGN